MIKLIRGDSDGVVEFELTGASADQLALLLKLPVVRDRTNAGICVTISPLVLTSGDYGETIREERDDSAQFRLEYPTAVEIEGRLL